MEAVITLFTAVTLCLGPLDNLFTPQENFPLSLSGPAGLSPCTTKEETREASFKLSLS